MFRKEREKKIADLEAQLQKESSETHDLILKSSDLEEEKKTITRKVK